MQRALALFAATIATAGLVAFATPAVAQDRATNTIQRAEITVSHNTLARRN